MNYIKHFTSRIWTIPNKDDEKIVILKNFDKHWKMSIKPIEKPSEDNVSSYDDLINEDYILIRDKKKGIIINGNGIIEAWQK